MFIEFCNIQSLRNYSTDQKLVIVIDYLFSIRPTERIQLNQLLTRDSIKWIRVNFAFGSINVVSFDLDEKIKKQFTLLKDIMMIIA